MTQISNYTELRAERIRLEGELRKQKAILKSEIRSVKEKLEPVGDVISFLGIFKKKETGTQSLLKTGVSLGIDLLVRDKLLSKAGWIMRAVLPLVLKGISNQFIKKKAPVTELVD